MKSLCNYKDGLVNECSIMMFKDIKFYFTEHVKAMFGTTQNSKGEPVTDYAFLLNNLCEEMKELKI